MHASKHRASNWEHYQMMIDQKIRVLIEHLKSWLTCQNSHHFMMVNSIVLMSALCTTAVHAEVLNYSCKVCIFPSAVNVGECDVGDGKSYPLSVDESRKVLEWRGKKYSILVASPDDKGGGCGKYGWQADGNGTTFTFCIATKGYGGISDTTGETRAQCCAQGGKCNQQ